MPQRKRVSLETSPHTFEIDLGPGNGGVVELQFRPEVMGTEFLDAYQDLLDSQKRVAELRAEDRRAAEVYADNALRQYLAKFMLPESAGQFITSDESSDVVTHKMPLPGWVLQEMSTWVAELYGRRPTQPSPESQPPPSKPGKPSTAGGRSKASTPTRGRSRG